MAVIFYDLVLVIALFFVATAIVLPLNQGEAIKSAFIYPLLFFVSFIFYGWFWTHGGQTLGLRAWKLRLVSDDEQEQTNINWKQALKRYITACFSWALFGLGILWCLWQKDSKTWQDLYSRTHLIHFDPKKD